MKYIDFRSDTVTLPTKEMLEYMMQAEMGDDVYDDDPTVKELEAYAAKLLGKEAALFTPSGTFANQLAILTHTTHGDEIIVCEESHIINHEVGATALIAGVTPRTVPMTNNIMDAKDIEKLIRGKDIHYPNTTLISIENAHSSGKIMPAKTMEDIKKLADQYNIPVHLDGARFFNAAKALNISYTEFASYATSINMCLSKGLCAPIGSLLIGPQAFIKKAKKYRKLMGGGMRQVGIIAAAGLYALKHMLDQIEIDNQNASYLAEKLSTIDNVEVLTDRLATNMVFFKLPQSIIAEDKLVNEMIKLGIKMNDTENDEYRLVTHYYITKKEIDLFVESLKKILISNV